MPKLPFVSYSLIFLLPAGRSHTLIRPSYVVAARNCPSSLKATAQISPALLPSTIEPSRSHSPESGERDQILTSPPKPALARTLPLREVARWWQPSLCAPVRVWARGMSGEVVECIFMEEAPDAEMIWVGVTAMEKMSVMWAEGVSLAGWRGSFDLPSSTVWVVRYCFDWNLLVLGSRLYWSVRYHCHRGSGNMSSVWR